MKYLLNIFVLTLYLLSNIGLYGKAHFCGGDLQSYAFYEQSLDSCCPEDEVAFAANASISSGCCSTTFFQWKQEVDHTANLINLSFFTSTLSSFWQTVFTFNPSNRFDALVFSYEHPPISLSTLISTCILFHSWIYYH